MTGSLPAVTGPAGRGALLRADRVWRLVGALAVLTVAARIGLYLVLARVFPHHWTYAEVLEWNGWGRIARFMAQGHGLADDELMTYYDLDGGPVPTAARPPLPILLFAATLRLFGERLWPAVTVQASLDAGTVVVIYLLTRRLFATGAFAALPGGDATSRLTALLAASGYAFFLPEYPYAIGFMSEPLFTLLLTGAMALVLLSRAPGGLAAAGLLFGLAALSRPSIIVFPLFLLPWLVWGKAVRVRHALLVPLVMGLALGPWVARNYVVFERVIVTGTLGGYNLFRYSGQLADDDYLREMSGRESKPRVFALVEAAGRTRETITEPELDALLRREARRIILAHPWRYLHLSLHRAAGLFYDDNVGRHTGAFLRPIYLALMLALLGSVAAGAWRYPGPWLGRLVPVWLLVGYTVVSHALIVAHFRFLVPLVPLLACASAYVLMRALAELRPRWLARLG